MNKEKKESKKVKVNAQDNFLKNFEDSKSEKYDFKIEASDVNFDEAKSDAQSKEDIKIKAKKTSDKDEASNWKDVTDVKAIYEDGWITRGLHIKVKDKKLKIGGTEVEFKKEIDKRLSTDIHHFTPTFYISGVALVLVIIGIVWYFFSSNKEDKEEESL